MRQRPGSSKKLSIIFYSTSTMAGNGCPYKIDQRNCAVANNCIEMQFLNSNWH